MTKKPSLGAIFLTVFLDLLGFGLVLPFLAEEARDGFHTSALTGTLLGAVYSLMQFLFVPVWGRLSDRIGRRPVLVSSIGATFVGMSGLGLALAYADSVAWLFAARIFSGIATANLGTASAYIADVTKPEDRARGMALIGIAFGLGFILGPGIGGALGTITIGGRQGPLACFVAAGLSVVNFTWAQIGLAESLPPERRAKSTRRLVPLDVHAAREAFKRPGIALAVLVNFLIILAFTNLDQTFRYYNKDLFGMSQMQTGLVLAAVGVVAAFVQGALIRPLTARFGEAHLIVAGVLLQAVAFSGVAWAPSVGAPMLFASMALLALGNGLTQPSTASYVSRRADPLAQGSTLGTNQSAAALARTFGPALGGLLYGALGPRSPYVAAAVGMAIALVFAIGLEGVTAPWRRPPMDPGDSRSRSP
jgi:MFS family permease